MHLYLPYVNHREAWLDLPMILDILIESCNAMLHLTNSQSKKFTSRGSADNLCRKEGCHKSSKTTKTFLRISRTQGEILPSQYTISFIRKEAFRGQPKHCWFRQSWTDRSGTYHAHVASKTSRILLHRTKSKILFCYWRPVDGVSFAYVFSRRLLVGRAIENLFQHAHWSDPAGKGLTERVLIHAFPNIENTVPNDTNALLVDKEQGIFPGFLNSTLH